ncbi:MAG: phosphodiester glycosidase family protein [Alistipes sp.]|nr:phosphodiester glycosidase family protein [Candidatus Alistipes equi]
MKYKSLLFSLLLFLYITCHAQNIDSLKFVHGEWNTVNIESGVTLSTLHTTLFGEMQYISIVRLHKKKIKLELIPHTRLEKTSLIATKQGAVSAINAGYWNVKKVVPSTLVRKDGLTLSRTEEREMFRVDGAVAFLKRGIKIFKCDTMQYAKYERKFRNLLACGPVLMLNGKKVDFSGKNKSFFTKRHPRTIIAQTRGGDILFIVIDGRHKGLATGMTTSEMAQMCSWLEVKNALNLDGGGSSTMWCRDYEIVNHPSDNHSFDNNGERSVSSSILAIKR